MEFMMFTHNWTKNCPFILIFKECFGWSKENQLIERGKEVMITKVTCLVCLQTSTMQNLEYHNNSRELTELCIYKIIDAVFVSGG